MTEYTDDTKTIRITLNAAAVPTPTPTTVSLEWIADNYDVNKTRYVDMEEMQQAGHDRSINKITQDQFDAILHAWQHHTLLPSTAGAPPPTTGAKGRLTNVAAPTSITAGHQVTVSCRVHNEGGTRGTFKIELSGSGVLMRSSPFYVTSGQTSPTKSLKVTTPTSGSSVTYTLKCIRTT